jgi:hypothetical protein
MLVVCINQRGRTEETPIHRLDLRQAASACTLRDPVACVLCLFCKLVYVGFADAWHALQRVRLTNLPLCCVLTLSRCCLCADLCHALQHVRLTPSHLC